MPAWGGINATPQFDNVTDIMPRHRVDCSKTVKKNNSENHEKFLLLFCGSFLIHMFTLKHHFPYHPFFILLKIKFQTKFLLKNNINGRLIPSTSWAQVTDVALMD